MYFGPVVMQARRKRTFGTYDGGYEKAKQPLPRVILPIFEPSGLLELGSHNKEGILLKHVEPSDARSPEQFWDKYNVPLNQRNLFQAVVYKRGVKTPLKEYDLGSRSSYILGRELGRSLNEQEKEVVVADIGIPEETCSKQHCAIQFREIGGKLLVYVIDLESSNGTSLNGLKLPSARYVQLRSGDLITLSEEDESNYEIMFMSV